MKDPEFCQALINFQLREEREENQLDARLLSDQELLMAKLVFDQDLNITISRCFGILDEYVHLITGYTNVKEGLREMVRISSLATNLNNRLYEVFYLYTWWEEIRPRHLERLARLSVPDDDEEYIAKFGILYVLSDDWRKANPGSLNKFESQIKELKKYKIYVQEEDNEMLSRIILLFRELGYDNGF